MTLKFSETPGSRERHLRRRHNNVLFPEQARAVTQDQVDAARREDLEERRRFENILRELLEDAARLDGHADTDAILDLKERIDRLYVQCAALPGTIAAMREGLARLNEVIMNTLRAAAQHDATVESELAREQAAHAMHLKLLEYPLVADLLHEDMPIPAEDLVPSLLSESPDDLLVIMSLFDPPQQEQLRTQAAGLVARLEHGGELPESVHAALAAIERPLQ